MELKKNLDISKLQDLGWEPSIKLEKGLIDTYEWYKENIDKIRNN